VREKKCGTHYCEVSTADGRPVHSTLAVNALHDKSNLITDSRKWITKHRTVPPPKKMRHHPKLIDGRKSIFIGNATLYEQKELAKLRTIYRGHRM